MALKEVMDEKNKQPETVNGAMLVMEEVVWAQPEDVKMWKKSLKMVAGKWVGDQIGAEVPFIPPDSAKVLGDLFFFLGGGGGGKGRVGIMVGLYVERRLTGDVNKNLNFDILEMKTLTPMKGNLLLTSSKVSC